MRRLLVVLLVLVVPLKAWASAALPLAAGMAHAGTLPVQHVGQMLVQHGGPDDRGAHAAHEHEHAGDECCAGHASAPHSHECPHLTMPILVPEPLAQALAPAAAERTTAIARAPDSVVLDILLPPPLA